jgi:hypothetical protein
MRSTPWALAYTALILLVTLLPGPGITAPPEDLPSALCLVCGQFGGADGVLNLLLFVPLGLALMAASGSALRAAACVLVLSSAIEFLQQVIPGRYAVLGDVVYNAAGGCAGIGLYALRGHLLRPGRRLAAALTLGTGVLAGSLFLLAGVLMTPSFPDTVYYGQWTAELHFLESYEGQVLDAYLGPMFLASRRTSDPASAVDLVRSGAPVRARIIGGTPPPALAPIVSIFDEHRSGILILGADEKDLVLWLRYRANDLRLQRPDLRIREALAAIRPGDTISLRAEAASKGYTLWVDQEEYSGLRHTPGEGWALLLHPRSTAPWVDSLLSMAWVAGLLVLVGWWAPGLRWAGAALLIALAGMALAAATAHLMGIAVLEVLAAPGGVVLGILLRRSWPKASPTPDPIC